MLPEVVFSEVPLEFPLSWVITPLPPVPACARDTCPRFTLSWAANPRRSASEESSLLLFVYVVTFWTVRSINSATASSKLICSRRQLVPADSPDSPGTAEKHDGHDSEELPSARLCHNVPLKCSPASLFQRCPETVPQSTSEEMWATLQHGDSLREEILQIHTVK